MLRRSCLDVIGTFSERTVSTRTDGLAADNGDWDMWIRIAEQFPIAHLGQPLIRYRLHEGQGTLTLTGDHVRLSKHLLRIDSLRRRGGPLWLRLMVARTWSQVMLGHLPVIGGRFSLMWHRLDRVLDLIEKRVIRALFRDAVYR